MFFSLWVHCASLRPVRPRLLIGCLYICQSTGKNLYFPMVPLFFKILFLKMAKNRILLKYSGKNHTFLIKTFENLLL